MTPLQSFKARCVPGARVKLLARWPPAEGEVREVVRLRSKDVVFLRPSDKESYLTLPRASEIWQIGPAEFEIGNEGETLRYAFDE